MALTPLARCRPNGRILALVALVALFGAACSATPTWIPVDGETAAAADVAVTSDEPSAGSADSVDVDIEDQPPAELAFVQASPSAGFCSASANIWIHSAALNLIGADATPEMNQIALANVAEWLERATLFDDEDDIAARTEMFAAFIELRATVEDDYAFDWLTFYSSTEYAQNQSAQVYDAARNALVAFVSERCDSLSMTDLRAGAQARADELVAEFGTAPSTLTESDSLPGHAIFTHSSGRLIASFPTAWAHDEGRSDAIVDLIASPDIDRFLANDVIDGVRLQLFDAPTIDAFRTLMANTMIGSSCELTNDLSDVGVVRMNITQTFECTDHGASIIGQYNPDRGLGLIIEASFDRPEASRADLIRLASIANSALWS